MHSPQRSTTKDDLEVSSIRAKVGRLERFPLIGRTGVYADTRELVVHKNCIVTYRVRADEIQLLQVWHSAQQRT